MSNTESLACSFIKSLLKITIFWHSLCYLIYGNPQMMYSRGTWNSLSTLFWKNASGTQCTRGPRPRPLKYMNLHGAIVVFQKQLCHRSIILSCLRFFFMVHNSCLLFHVSLIMLFLLFHVSSMILKLFNIMCNGLGFKPWFGTSRDLSLFFVLHLFVNFSMYSYKENYTHLHITTVDYYC